MRKTALKAGHDGTWSRVLKEASANWFTALMASTQL
jgi:hypothetical protein